MKPSTRKILAIAAKFEQKLYSYDLTPEEQTKFNEAARLREIADPDPVEEVKAFQEKVTTFSDGASDRSRKIKDRLSKELSPPWNFQRDDADGKWGARTATALNIIKQEFGVNTLAEATKALSENVQDTAASNVKLFQGDIQVFKTKLGLVHDAISKATNNFTSKLNIGSDQLMAQYLPFLNPEYAQLYQASQQKRLAGLEPQFQELVKQMNDLFGAVMGGVQPK